MSGVATSDNAQAGWLFRIGVPVALVLYTLLMFGLTEYRQMLGVTMLVTTGVYLLTVFLYAGIPSLVFTGQWRYFAVGIVGAIGLSILWIGQNSQWVWITTWIMLFGATIATGYLARAGKSASTVFSVGVLIVLVMSFGQFVPMYPDLAELASASVDGILNDVRVQLAVGGYAPEMVDEYVSAFRQLLNTMIRLMPCGFVLGATMQYAIGFAWFSHRVVAPAGQRAVVPSFATWRAPFGLVFVVVIGSLLRIFGNETMKLVADNLLVGVGVVYVIVGMALIESFLRKVYVGWLGRVFVYIALFLAQVVGLLVVALLGFIDSYVDWRARAQRSIDETV